MATFKTGEKIRAERFENMQFGQKRCMFEAVDKESVLLKRLVLLERYCVHCTFHWDNRKDDLTVSSELGEPYPWQAQGYECVNSFE
jgi:hypothetical protein